MKRLLVDLADYAQLIWRRNTPTSRNLRAAGVPMRRFPRRTLYRPPEMPMVQIEAELLNWAGDLKQGEPYPDEPHPLS